MWRPTLNSQKVQGEEWSSREGHQGQPGLEAPPEEGRIHHMLRMMSFSFLLKVTLAPFGAKRISKQIHVVRILYLEGNGDNTVTNT